MEGRQGARGTMDEGGRVKGQNDRVVGVSSLNWERRRHRPLLSGGH